jgi:hypothetical protein
MKKILLIVALMFSFNVYAIDSSAISSAGFGNLTESEKASILADVAKMSEAKGSTTNKPVVEKIDKWVDLGTKIGQGLGGAAKELGLRYASRS